MEKNLNLFPQFLVRYPDNGLKNEDNKPILISEHDFELSLFAIDSLLHVMNISLPIQQSPEAVIEFTDAKTYPETLRSQKIIYLTSEPDYWANTCYQLAHEMCHYMIPGDVVSTLRWLEESICELASCYFLLEFSKYWKRLGVSITSSRTGAPYYLALEEYVKNTLEKIHSLNLNSFCSQSPEILQTLEKFCYCRETNRNIALRLLPIFQHFPEVWHAVPLLSELNASQPLLDALKQWLTLAPKESCIALQEVAQLFGASISLD